MDFDPNLMVTYEIFEHVLESCPEICDAIHNQLWCKVGPERKMDALKFHGAEISERFNELESSRSLSKKDPTGFQVQVTTNLNVGRCLICFCLEKVVARAGPGKTSHGQNPSSAVRSARGSPGSDFEPNCVRICALHCSYRQRTSAYVWPGAGGALRPW
jgi:hypothetical protein